GRIEFQRHTGATSDSADQDQRRPRSTQTKINADQDQRRPRSTLTKINANQDQPVSRDHGFVAQGWSTSPL
ncbi:MAG TPA: hypothetical protein VIJ23_15020, partial [Mycobacterium sp.]